MAHSVAALKNLVLVMALSCAISGYAFASEAREVSGIIIKVDSAGMKAEIISTGKGGISDKVDIRNPQARLLAREQATAAAYKRLLETVKTISADYFPKERYLVNDKFLKGAKLTEARYYGDGSAEVDIELDVALNNPIVDRFERDMKLSGYRVIEYDRPDAEIMEGDIK